MPISLPLRRAYTRLMKGEIAGELTGFKCFVRNGGPSRRDTRLLRMDRISLP